MGAIKNEVEMSLGRSKSSSINLRGSKTIWWTKCPKRMKNAFHSLATNRHYMNTTTGPSSFSSLCVSERRHLDMWIEYYPAISLPIKEMFDNVCLDLWPWSENHIVTACKEPHDPFCLQKLTMLVEIALAPATSVETSVNISPRAEGIIRNLRKTWP